eukprot:SAG31_NODE_44330_length_263_cov_0.634146_1_plen_44_part_01
MCVLVQACRRMAAEANAAREQSEAKYRALQEEAAASMEYHAAHP